VQQGPQLGISEQNNIPTFATVTAIGAAFWISLRTMKMVTAGPTFATATTNLYIINKIRLGHSLQRYFSRNSLSQCV
jgi:hypothetical protein